VKDTVRLLAYMTEHNPLAVLGFSLIGTFSILFIHIQFKMREIGLTRAVLP
jgi:hypothetical protein